MKNRLIISITDVYGTRSYNFSDAIKKIVKYSIVSIILILLVGTFSIVFLTSSLSTLEEKKNHTISDLKDKKDNLISKLETLNKENQGLAENINHKAKELEHLSDKIIDIEKIVGITAYDKNDKEFDSRIDVAKLTYIDKQYMLKVIPSGYPIPKKGVSSSYGRRFHPVLKRSEFHPGIDLRAKMRTKVRAPADGIIKYAGFNQKGYGNIVIISHNFGFETLYAHLSKTKVRIGKIVRKGDVVALTGNSGLSSGPHLHYEVRYAQRRLNPAWFLRWTMENYDELFKKQRKIKWQSLIAQIKGQTEPLKQQ